MNTPVGRVEPLLARVEAALRPDAPGAVLVAAVSGGVDSVALAHLLVRLRARLDCTLHIAHFDHALRPEAAEDAAFVAALAAKWGAPCHSARWAHGDAFPGGVEAAARAARYAFLADVARRVAPAGAPPILLTAHHADDQAETLLLNLLRGSGVRGLAAMRPRTRWGTGDPPLLLLRPLLRTARSEILAYANSQGLHWREDASNQATDRTRNLLRQQVLPLLAQVNPGVGATLARTAALLGYEADRLDALDARLLEQALAAHAPDARIVLRYTVLQTLGVADRSALLRAALRRAFPTLRDVGFEQIEPLALALAQPAAATGPHTLAADLVWTVLPGEDGGLLSLHRAEALPLPPATPWLDAEWRRTVARVDLPAAGAVTIPGGWALEVETAARPAVLTRPAASWETWLDAAAPRPLHLTTPLPGMRIAPLGMRGQRRLLGDIFTDRKVAPPLRSGWPVVVDADGRVLWVCGLLVAEDAAAPDAGAPALHLRWVRAEAVADGDSAGTQAATA